MLKNLFLYGMLPAPYIQILGKLLRFWNTCDKPQRDIESRTLLDVDFKSDALVHEIDKISTSISRGNVAWFS